MNIPHTPSKTVIVDLVDVVETRETEQGEMEAYVHFRGRKSLQDVDTYVV